MRVHLVYVHPCAVQVWEADRRSRELDLEERDKALRERDMDAATLSRALTARKESMDRREGALSQREQVVRYIHTVVLCSTRIATALTLACRCLCEFSLRTYC